MVSGLVEASRLLTKSVLNIVLVILATGSVVLPSSALALSPSIDPPMTSHERANLIKLFECQPAVDYELLDNTMEKFRISPSAELYWPRTSLVVFGVPIQKVSIFRESGEDVYRAFPQGLTEQQMAAAARLKKHKRGAYQRSTEVGVISVEDYQGLHFQCSVVTAFEY